MKGGALSGIGVKKGIRLSEIATQNGMPLIHMTESAGGDLTNHKIAIMGPEQLAGVAVEAEDDVAIGKAWISMGEKELCFTQQPRFLERVLLDDKRSCMAPMPGRVLQVMARIGQTVKKGEPLLILEAMKMEHTVTALSEGIILAVLVQEGQLVDIYMPLLQFE